MSFFISDAVASAGAPAQGSPYSLIIMLVVFGLIFYFMILRPQQKRAKDHKKLMDSIGKGDEVLTTGGLIGRVTEVDHTAARGRHRHHRHRAERHHGSDDQA